MTNILILDDDTQILRLASTMLEREGYQCRTTEDSQTALDWIEQEEPDLILTDILMPNIDGIEFINHCRKKGVQSHLIAMSGGRRKLSAEFNLKSAEMLGANDSLPKPFSRQQLVATVKRVMSAAHSEKNG